jgi:E3 ubiquitin-protein ligase TRIP12
VLINGLKDEGNEAMQLQSLMELCDFLSIGTEENMANFALDSFVPLLVNLLNMEHNPDIMLLACRSLAYLMEALPAASGTLVAHQAVPALCSKLLSIEYIDLAEQALQVCTAISCTYVTVSGKNIL